jgi:hypothetical protein
MNRLLRAGTIVLLVVGVAACSSRFESFAFQTAEGTHVQIWQSGRVARDQEARFTPTAGHIASPVYRLDKPALSAPGQAFAVSYTSSVPTCTLTLFSDKNKVLKSVTLPATSGNALRFLVSLETGSRLWGYQFSAPKDAAQGTLAMTGTGTSAYVHGFLIGANELTVDGSVEVASASAGVVSARIPAATRDEMASGIWCITLLPQEGAAGARIVFSDAEGRKASYDVNPASTPARLDFARGSIPFLPTSIDYAGTLAGLSISRIGADAPLPADPGLILTWDRSTWRKPDFELFSWSRFPQVLILDTASYELQDALFKRLAFYVEKSGHAGKIESQAALSGLHGYNAHDYRAEDLARFFTAATAGGLSAEEGTLEKLLVANGIITKSASGYAPGEGSILSLSRSSAPLLRDLLLTHECFHGAYFSLPAFRDATEALWTSLSDVERQVWLDYLGSHAYDISDHYLVVNEFQSYLMQQERIGIWGFQDRTLAGMREAGGKSAHLARQLASSRPMSFLKSFDALDEALQSAGGPPGGHAISVRLVE